MLDLFPDLSSLHLLMDFIRKFSEKIPYQKRIRLEVACEEIFTNIVHYSKHPKDQPIQVSVEMSDQKMTVIFIDQGKAFDPTKYRNPSPDILVEGKKGIVLIQKCVDDWQYLRKEKENIFKLYLSF